ARYRCCAPSRSRSCASSSERAAWSARVRRTYRHARLVTSSRATTALTARARTTRRIDGYPSHRPLFAMAFSRFFGRGRDAAPTPPEAPEAEASADEEVVDESVDTVDEDALPEDVDQRSWRERADAVLPTGASTG